METMSRKTKSLGKKENFGQLQHLYKQYSQYDVHSLRLILANLETKHEFREGVIAVTTAVLQALVLPLAVFILVIAARLLPALTQSLFPQLDLMLYCFLALVVLTYLLLLYGKMLNSHTKRRIRLLTYLIEVKQAEKSPDQEEDV